MDVQKNRKIRGKVNEQQEEEQHEEEQHEEEQHEEEQQEEEQPKEDDMTQMNKTSNDIEEIKNEEKEVDKEIERDMEKEKEVDKEIERDMEKEKQIENQMKEMECIEENIRKLENDDNKKEIIIDQKEVGEFEVDKDKIKKTEISVNVKEEETHREKHYIMHKENIKNDTDCLITENKISKFEQNVIKQEGSQNEERKQELEYENRKVNDYYTENAPLTYFLSKQENCDICNKLKDDLERENETSNVNIATNNDGVENGCYISNTQNEKEKGKGKGNTRRDIDITKEEGRESICGQTVVDNCPHTFLREQKDNYKKEEEHDISKYMEHINIRNKNDNIVYLKNENEITQFVNNFVASAQYKCDKHNSLVDGYKQTKMNNISKDKCNITPKGKSVYFDTKQVTVKQYIVPTNDILTEGTKTNDVATTNIVTNETKNNNLGEKKRNHDWDINISTTTKSKGKIKMKLSKEKDNNVSSEEDTLLLVKFLCQAKSYNLIKLSKVFLSKKITYKFFDEQNILSVFLTPENAVKNFCSSEDIYKIDNLNIKKNINHTNTKYIFFIFKNGSVVIWENFKNVENNNFFINKMIVFINSFSNELLPLHIVQYDTIYYCEQHKKKCSINGGVIYLTNDCLEQKLTVSFALSQSIRLDVHETTMDIAINTLFSISKEIAAKGSCNITKEKVSSMHNIYSSIINVNAVQDFLDIPEYFWNKVQYEHLWFEIYQYLEIPERIKILNKRYDYYKDFLKVITTELYNKKTFHCYWIVVLLLFIHIFILILNDVFFMK